MNLNLFEKQKLSKKRSQIPFYWNEYWRDSGPASGWATSTKKYLVFFFKKKKQMKITKLEFW